MEAKRQGKRLVKFTEAELKAHKKKLQRRRKRERKRTAGAVNSSSPAASPIPLQNFHASQRGLVRRTSEACTTMRASLIKAAHADSQEARKAILGKSLAMAKQQFKKIDQAMRKVELTEQRDGNRDARRKRQAAPPRGKRPSFAKHASAKRRKFFQSRR